MNGLTALIVASQKGHTEVVRIMLAAGADPRIANHSGRTALAIAKHHKHPAVVKLLESRLLELAGGSSK